MKTIVKLCNSKRTSMIKSASVSVLSQQVLSRQSNTWLGFLPLGHGISNRFSSFWMKLSIQNMTIRANRTSEDIIRCWGVNYNLINSGLLICTPLHLISLFSTLVSFLEKYWPNHILRACPLPSQSQKTCLFGFIT